MKDFDVGKEVLTTLFSLSSKEGEELDDMIISTDGKKLADGDTEKANEEDKSNVKILSSVKP